MKIIQPREGKGKIIKSWCNAPEHGAIEQARNLAALPFIFKHVAGMPDLHKGFGVPIGCVFATMEVIIPNAVGKDIGCGMSVVKTSLTTITKSQVEKIKEIIEETIPVGKKWNKEPQNADLMPANFNKIPGRVEDSTTPICRKEFDKALYQLGTLGGGNHFIEIQKGNDGHIWIMIHSGSRNIGKQVADYYDKQSKEINKKWFSSIPPSYDLAFLPANSEIGLMYFREMNYCLEFARNNRQLMRQRVLDIFMKEFKGIGFLQWIDVHHNYATWEHHYGRNVIVHRKGATSAKKDELGIIPGSQGTKSYIIKGKGNPESFMSCSHGAGRIMGRREAKEKLNLEEEIKRMDEKGIVHSIKSQKDLDEAAGAYKDISVVMEEQKDLVDIEVELEPLGAVKAKKK